LRSTGWPTPNFINASSVSSTLQTSHQIHHAMDQPRLAIRIDA
jgi:hypothetical protein